MEILIGELTVEQYITLIGYIFGLIILSCLCASIIFHIIKFIIDMIEYSIRKDKYKNRDFATIRAYKHIAILRRQFKSARTETEYYIFYNRLTAAFMAYVEIGLIPYEHFLKIVRVCPVYCKNFYERIRREKERAADEAATVKESEEK